jgi:hypothetical protein
VIRIAISAKAFAAIAATLPLGSVGYENKVNEKGERLILLEPNAVANLRACAGLARVQRRDPAAGRAQAGGRRAPAAKLET